MPLRYTTDGNFKLVTFWNIRGFLFWHLFSIVVLNYDSALRAKVLLTADVSEHLLGQHFTTTLPLGWPFMTLRCQLPKAGERFTIIDEFRALTLAINIIWYIDIDGLVQKRRNSIANALELRISCTNPSIWNMQIKVMTMFGCRIQTGWTLQWFIW